MIFAEKFVDGIKTQIAAIPAYAGAEKHRLPPTNDDYDFPIVNVTWTADAAPSRGGPRTGVPTFEHTTTIIIEVIDRDNDGPGLRAKLSGHGQSLMSALMTDLAWGGSVLEGIAAVYHQVDLPIEGNFNIGRLQIRVEALSSSTWDAAPPADDFDGITITTPPTAFDGLKAAADIP